MGSASQPLSAESQILSQTKSFNTNASGAATVSFPNPPAGFTWTGTLSCALASTGSVFLATVGGVSWGEWGGNSVYGPVQVLGNGGQQLVVTVTGLAASTNYVLQWNGSSDPSYLVAAVWPDSNSTALTAQISGTVPVTVSNTVATNSNITNSSIPVTGSLATTAPGTTINGAGFTGASTSLTVASTTGFSTSGFLGVPGSGGTLIFAYTGTTSVSFTGVSLVSGTAGWTIANGAAITQTTASPSSVGVTGSLTTVGTITNPVTTNPNAATSDLLHSGTTSAVGANPTVTLLNTSETSTYTGFLLIVSSYVAGNNNGITFTLTNTVTGQTTSQQIRGLNALAAAGITNFSLWFPATVNSGNTYTLTGANSQNTGTSSITWALVGFRYSPYVNVQTSPLASLDVVQYGGLQPVSLGTVAAGTVSTVGLGGPTDNTPRLHGVGIAQSGAAAAITNSIVLSDGSGNTLGGYDFTSSTSAIHTTFLNFSGLLLASQSIQVSNFTNRAMVLTAWVDWMTTPNIS